MEPPSFEDIYDPTTLRAIEGDRVAAHQTQRLGRMRRTAAGAALAGAVVNGVQHVLEPEIDQAFEEIDPGISGGPDQPVTLFFVPNDPHATRAVVRPWLFDGYDKAATA